MSPIRRLIRLGITSALTTVLVVAVAGLATGAGATATGSFTAVDLGTLGGDASAAMAVSSTGQVVGSSITAGGRWHAFSWTQAGKMVDLGTLGDPYVDSFAVGVNANGQVVGYARPVGGNDPQRAFFWSQGTGMVNLGTLGGDTIVEPAAINASGQVVGTSWAPSTQSHAFSWTQAGGMVDIGTLGGTGVRANDISDGGEIVGISGRGRVSPPGPHAFSWTPSGGMVDLGTLGGTASEALAINELRQIVGWSMTSAQGTHAFFWSPGSGMVDLGTLGGSTSRAIAINAGGQIVGSSTTAAGAEHAFSWTQAGGMVDLGTLGGSTSTPTGISTSGQVVGYSTNASGAERAFLWQDGKMTDLGTLGAPQARATAINDRGQVVGYSHTGGGWNPRALLWSPAVARPVIGAPSPSPATPVAGKRFTVSFKVTRSDTGKPLTSGTMVVDPSVGDKVLRHTESFKSGIARVSLAIPKSAKGKQLKVKATITYEGQSTTKVSSFRIR